MKLERNFQETHMNVWKTLTRFSDKKSYTKANQLANHKRHGFVAHAQRQNTTEFRAQNVAKEP